MSLNFSVKEEDQTKKKGGILTFSVYYILIIARGKNIKLRKRISMCVHMCMFIYRHMANFSLPGQDRSHPKNDF